jgi:hypothetical protein
VAFLLSVSHGILSSVLRECDQLIFRKVFFLYITILILVRTSFYIPGPQESLVLFGGLTLSVEVLPLRVRSSGFSLLSHASVLRLLCAPGSLLFSVSA